MLPDFPALKTEIKKKIAQGIRQRIEAKEPLLRQIRRLTQHEGKSHTYQQLGGAESMTMPYKMVSAELETKVSDVPLLYGPKLEEKLNDLAENIAKQMATQLFQTVGESCDRAGTSLDGKGAPMSAEMLLRMYETMQLDFDESGKPTATIVIHPNMTESLKRAIDQLENDPKIKQRYEEILRRQRDSWADRESRRKLVD